MSTCREKEGKLYVGAKLHNCNCTDTAKGKKSHNTLLGRNEPLTDQRHHKICLRGFKSFSKREK